MYDGKRGGACRLRKEAGKGGHKFGSIEMNLQIDDIYFHKKMINDTVTALLRFIVINLCRIDLSSLSIFSFVKCFIRHFLITLSIDGDWSSLRS